MNRYTSQIKPSQTKRREQYKESKSSITVWDLPRQVIRSEVFEATRHLGRIDHIEIIKEDHHKLRAEIDFTQEKFKSQEEIPWVIPFHNEVLVRETPGINKTEVLEERKQYTLKLYNVPKNANEILLFRQIRYANAKGVHVFRNTNGNNKSYAIVTFKNKEDMIEAKKHSITYYNTKLN